MAWWARAGVQEAIGYVPKIVYHSEVSIGTSHSFSRLFREGEYIIHTIANFPPGEYPTYVRVQVYPEDTNLGFIFAQAGYCTDVMPFSINGPIRFEGPAWIQMIATSPASGTNNILIGIEKVRSA